MKTKYKQAVARMFVIAALIACVSMARFTPRDAAAFTNRNSVAQTQSQDQDIPDSAIIQPDELAKELAGSAKPIVVCVAPHFLYQGAHIPGAVFHGPGSSPDGARDLRQWVQTEPHDANIVIYCGCCPMARCPNIRPALHVLTEMGFTHVKVLWLAKDFHTDWIEKGYPAEKGQ
jgi:rhodanese-related sulfurtransferase